MAHDCEIPFHSNVVLNQMKIDDLFMACLNYQGYLALRGCKESNLLENMKIYSSVDRFSCKSTMSKVYGRAPRQQLFLLCV